MIQQLTVKVNVPELNNDEFQITLQKPKEITIDVEKDLDLLAVQVLQLIFTQNLGLKYELYLKIELIFLSFLLHSTGTLQ